MRDQESMSEMIFRLTNAQKGRRVVVTPENSSMKHLGYGRSILHPDSPALSETGKLRNGPATQM
jgi:hypothetical protein